MSHTFHQSYDLLGLKPGDGWSQLKTAYRSQVRAAHPDRYQNDPKRERIAEDRTKAINAAYKELADYYRRHGRLPLDPASDPPRPLRPADTIWSGPIDRPQIQLDWQSLFGPVARWTAIALLLGGAYWVANILVDRPLDQPLSVDRPKIPDTRSVAVSPEMAEQPAAAFFRIGSSLGEVYAVQGVPTRTENNVWHYGSSRVYFAKGGVIRWEESPEHPLKARIDAEPAQAMVSYYTIGSTKSDVRRLQGEPVRENEKVWDYGVSRVYFEADRVVGWDESPLNPLKAKR